MSRHTTHGEYADKYPNHRYFVADIDFAVGLELEKRAFRERR